ncbi:hypothetical protein TIFTF001_049397, partial [Ficus carica]
MEGGVRRDQWGYEVTTYSDACISAINDYYHQVLIYGRERFVILKATENDKDCVLANILAAHFLSSSYPSLAPSYLHAAKSRLWAILFVRRNKLPRTRKRFSMCENRDDDVALELHFK